MEYIHLEGIKGWVKLGEFEEALLLVKKCFAIIKKQIYVLSEVEDKDDKFKKTIENKGDVLETLFYLELGCRSEETDLPLNEIMNGMLARYEMLYRKIGLKLDESYLFQNIYKINKETTE